jgi:hypothetical protein
MAGPSLGTSPSQVLFSPTLRGSYSAALVLGIVPAWKAFRICRAGPCALALRLDGPHNNLALCGGVLGCLRSFVCGTDMSKNIVIFSDGTGQAGGLPDSTSTNVYLLFKGCPIILGVQETFYDPGLGSPPMGARLRHWRRLYNLVCQITGLGISRNIADCYNTLICLYQPGDRIFLFGFSRGAYTVRSLGGLISLCGIPQVSARGLNLRANTRARRRAVWRAIRWVYQTYGRSEVRKRLRHERAKRFRRQYQSHDVVPYFVGVWESVRALGLPGVSRFVPWRHAFHDATLNPQVPYARHALSIDENRRVFVPALWDETKMDRQSGRINQVWFPGVHSDVGGGYHERELGDLALTWMIAEATNIPHPLIVERANLNLNPSHLGIQHDERLGWGRLWWKGTRDRLHVDNFQFERHVPLRVGEDGVPTVHGTLPYRPLLLARYPEFKKYYDAIAGRRRSVRQKVDELLARFQHGRCSD